MIQDLRFKPDFSQTVKRFEAWWHGELIDRPVVTLGVRADRPYRGPQKSHATIRDRWMDVEYNVERAVAWMEQTDFVADNLPIFFPNVGPEITGALYGCELEFTLESSWSTPIIHLPEEWESILEREPDFDNPYWQVIERMTDYALELRDGRYLVGITDLHGNYDILAALRDPEVLCIDLIDCPDVIQKVGRHVAHGFVKIFQRSYQKLAAAGLGATTWTPAYHAGPAYVPSCDFWCMISPQMAREMVLPDILVEMEPLERSIFHLDGPQALPHLDLLLEIPNLNAVQWVYGAGNEPAARWIDVYRRCRQAGKSVQVLATGPQDALTVLEAIGPQGVWLSVGGTFASREEANDFLREVERRC